MEFSEKLIKIALKEPEERTPEEKTFLIEYYEDLQGKLQTLEELSESDL